MVLLLLAVCIYCLVIRMCAMIIPHSTHALRPRIRWACGPPEVPFELPAWTCCTVCVAVVMLPLLMAIVIGLPDA